MSSIHGRTWLAAWGGGAALLVGLATGLSGQPAQAQSAAELFKGKQINIYVGTGPGGGYDFYARLVARFIAKHISDSTSVIVTNMPGAGSLRAANYVWEVAPKDGTGLGLITQTVALEEALGTPGVRYHAAGFNWIGRVTSNIEVSLAVSSSPVKNIEDAKRIEMTVAGTGPGLASTVYPTVLNHVVGTKFRIISGYAGSAESLLAMERGEVEGALTSLNSLKTTQKDWIDQKKVNLLVQFGNARHPELPNVPAVVELGKTDEDKQVLALYASGAVVGRAILAPPNMPPARLKALQDAFQAMLKDPEFLAEIEKNKIEFDPATGDFIKQVVAEAANISPAVLARAKAARGM
jgi:tripartite-type tricarboxylate transporter receptor subunit TctC